ncbi:hypothetical protein ACIPLR_26395 [Herbaspirillum huttiense]|jgi:hypothetical protein|uniref:hypothetical protein n=1 Tax=Herbaspirillum huttiense TaxID=863372 RepID=UPI0037FF961A
MTLDRFDDIDLSPALRAIHRLELDEGDLGRAYWCQISELIKEAASFRQRALVAEEQLRRQRNKGQRRRSSEISTEEIRRMSVEYSRDVARMQKVLLVAGEEYQVDDLILIWCRRSRRAGKAWESLPIDDNDLLLHLLSAVKP